MTNYPLPREGPLKESALGDIAERMYQLQQENDRLRTQLSDRPTTRPPDYIRTVCRFCAQPVEDDQQNYRDHWQHCPAHPFRTWASLQLGMLQSGHVSQVITNLQRILSNPLKGK